MKRARAFEREFALSCLLLFGCCFVIRNSANSGTQNSASSMSAVQNHVHVCMRECLCEGDLVGNSV